MWQVTGSNGLGFMVFWRFWGKGSLTQSISELMTATLGLLKTLVVVSSHILAYGVPIQPVLASVGWFQWVSCDSPWQALTSWSIDGPQLLLAPTLQFDEHILDDVLHSTALYWTELYCPELHCTVFTALQSIEVQCTVLHFSALLCMHWTEVHCNALHWTAVMCCNTL